MRRPTLQKAIKTCNTRIEFVPRALVQCVTFPRRWLGQKVGSWIMWECLVLGASARSETGLSGVGTKHPECPQDRTQSNT